MQQESTVIIGDQQVIVRSEVVVDPEVLITTTVTSEDGRQLKKSHTPVPPAAVAEYAKRGPDALKSTLQTSHLRFIQHVLAAPTQSQRRRPQVAPTTGVLATQVLGANGRVVRSMGEDQVPGTWLQTGFLVSTMAAEIGQALGLGAPTWCVAEGDGISLVMTVADPDGGIDEHHVKLCYVDPHEVSTEQAQLGTHLEAV